LEAFLGAGGHLGINPAQKTAQRAFWRVERRSISVAPHQPVAR